MQLSWLKVSSESWLSSLEQGRAAHAVMLLGPSGSGKRAMAAWMARKRLGLADAGALPEYPYSVPAHADLHWLQPPEDKHSIGVDQVRALTNDLHLTSYEGHGKVAVVEPAHVLTANAANGLLKTLEEPAGDALIILIVDRVGRLPATIFSRCQRLNFLCPAYPDSLEWLNQYQPGAAWPQALQASNGAPLAAVAALERLDDTESMAREWIDIAERRGEPLSVAERWSKYEPEFVLGWLGGQVQAAIAVLSGDSTVADASVLPDTVLRRIDRRNLFCYLDLINRLRGQAIGSYNVLLAFESLLIDWANGLTGMYGSNDNDVSGLSFMSGSQKR